MAYTIDFEDDFVGTEDLQLLKTKQAILEKLRRRFGEETNTERVAAAQREAGVRLSRSITSTVPGTQRS
jgi:hypothetical protein